MRFRGAGIRKLSGGLHEKRNRVDGLRDGVRGQLVVTEYMHYGGRAVEVFGRTPTGQPIPRLDGDIAGETVGDVAFVNDKAMEWDGLVWVPSPWKDFAVWRRISR
jgi:hypothetical protein